MARRWEEPLIETFDERAEQLGFYRRYNKRAQALAERRFDPSSLRREDLRHGDTRRFMLDDGYGDLDEVYDVKNSFEGLTD